MTLREALQGVERVSIEVNLQVDHPEFVRWSTSRMLGWDSPVEIRGRTVVLLQTGQSLLTLPEEERNR